MPRRLSARTVSWLLACTCALGLAPHARADWSPSIEGGATIGDSGGGTRLRLGLANESRPISQYVFADWVRDADDGDSFRVGYLPRYWFTRSVYAFVEARWRADEPLGIDDELQLVGGLGLRRQTTPGSAFYVEVGAGAKETRLDDDMVSSENDRTIDSDVLVLRGGGFHSFADRLRLGVDADASRADDLLEAQVEGSVAVRIAGGAVRYAVRSRWLDREDAGSVRVDDSFVSYSFAF